MTRRAAVIGVVILVSACAPSTTGSTATASATSAPAGPSTTVTTLPPTSTTVTTTGSFPPVEFECPPVLVSGQDTIRIDADCSSVPLEVQPISDPVRGNSLLMDDLGGGLLFQTDHGVIWWQAIGDPEAERVVSAEDGERVSLQDVVRIDERVESWYLREQGSGIEDYVVFLERSALTGGQTSVVGEVGSWETGSAVTVGGDTVAMERWAEAFYRFDVRDLELNPLPQPWNPYDGRPLVDVGCDDCSTGLIVSDDGTRAVFLSPLVQEAITLPVLVVVDLVSGDEVARIEVSGFGWPLGSPAEGPEITTIDVLGDLVLINGADDGQPFPAIWADVGAAEPVWEALEVPGSARFLRSDMSS